MSSYSFEVRLGRCGGWGEEGYASAIEVCDGDEPKNLLGSAGEGIEPSIQRADGIEH
jgi:hypothetical protein